MTKILGAAVTLLAVASASSAFADSERIVTGIARPTYSALQSHTTGSGTFQAVDAASASRDANAIEGGNSQSYPRFAQGEQRGAMNIYLGSSADPDYRFELVGPPTQHGGIGKMHQSDSESLVMMRLVHRRDGSPVTNAEVILERTDMGPDGMGDMTARAYIRPYGDPGTYRVEIHPAMAGRWAVTVAARIADQPIPVRQSLTVALAK
ncbi:MAG: FixH family protein [Alphaproteobacteria bacterium]|nr:FixH family protein [Alphaproteobacteria bacterium]